MNEILWATIGQIPVQSFYLEAYNTIRNSTYAYFLMGLAMECEAECTLYSGIGAGAGPYIAIHEGFQGVGSLYHYLNLKITSESHFFCSLESGKGKHYVTPSELSVDHSVS